MDFEHETRTLPVELTKAVAITEEVLTSCTSASSMVATTSQTTALSQHKSSPHTEAFIQASASPQTSCLLLLPNYQISYKVLIGFISKSTLPIASTQLKDHLLSHVCQKFEINFEAIDQYKQARMRQKINKFLQTFRSKLKKSGSSRHLDRVLQDKWSRNTLSFQFLFIHHSKTAFNGKTSNKLNLKSPKKKKTFQDLSSRGKFLVSKGIREKYEPEALQFAASQTLSTTAKKRCTFCLQQGHFFNRTYCCKSKKVH